ncbi:MAG: hypothetical protein ABIY48_07680 [Acidimicrobiales bacterium]
MSHRRRRVLGTLIALLAIAPLAVPAAQAGSGFRPAMLNVTGWTRLASPTLAGTKLVGAPLPNAGDGIGPGSYLLIDQTDGNSYICTANFVWTDGSKTYLGAAGHCFLRAGDVVAPPATPGFRVKAVSVCVSSCAFGGQLGSVVRGDLRPLGPVVFARQSESGQDVGNDFGLVEIPSALLASVRHSVPVWGGPTGTPAAPGLGQRLCLYGNAGGLGEVFATKARAGVAGQGTQSAWFASIPSAPGDSCAAVVSCPSLTGTTAAGILTHLATNGTGFIAGTTVERARTMVYSGTGKLINVLNA